MCGGPQLFIYFPLKQIAVHCGDSNCRQVCVCMHADKLIRVRPQELKTHMISHPHNNLVLDLRKKKKIRSNPEKSMNDKNV